MDTGGEVVSGVVTDNEVLVFQLRKTPIYHIQITVINLRESKGSS